MHHVRLERDIQISNALTFMAGNREQAEEAWPGDIIGLHNHGTIQVGDTFTQGEKLNFSGIPYFAPELFNIADDPEELTDCAKDPVSKAALDKFEETLRRMVDPTKIDRAAKDSMAALIENYGGREKAIDLGRSGSTPVPGRSPE